MDSQEAKRLVMQREERMPINRQWLGRMIGKPPQSVTQWLTGTEPRDPQVWVQMANVLGITPGSDPRVETVRETALYILQHSDDREIRTRAAQLLREFSEKYS